jgi:predicted RNase H-like nuclease (RuvC/YqgF family)
MSLNTILICGSWLIAIIAYICYGSIKEKYESLKNQNMELKGDVKELKEVISVLENEGKLKTEKEREINEKINELHIRDSVSNAINGLCKH